MINQSVTQTITIGRTNIQVLPLGVGAMTWGNKPSNQFIEWHNNNIYRG